MKTHDEVSVFQLFSRTSTDSLDLLGFRHIDIVSKNNFHSTRAQTRPSCYAYFIRIGIVEEESITVNYGYFLVLYINSTMRSVNGKGQGFTYRPDIFDFSGELWTLINPSERKGSCGI